MVGRAALLRRRGRAAARPYLEMRLHLLLKCSRMVAGEVSGDTPARNRSERAQDDPPPWTDWLAWASERLRDDGALFRHGPRPPATFGGRWRWPLLRLPRWWSSRDRARV